MAEQPVSNQSKSTKPLRQGDVTCATAMELTTACKKHGIRLATDETLPGQFTLQAKLCGSDPASGPLVRLWEAFTSPDHYYLGPDAIGLTKRESKWLIPMCVQDELNGLLADDCSTIRRLSDRPITRCFVYVDVSDFSQHLPGQQALIVASLVSLVRDWQYWNYGFALDAWKDLEAMLCIGDGYIFVFKNVVCATYFAAHLAQLIEVWVARRRFPVEFHFRMGVHVGPVFCFWDWGRGGKQQSATVVETGAALERTEVGDWNYIGEGINGGQRVLAAVGKETDDVVFISGSAKQELTARDDGTMPCRQILNSLLNRGRKTDKHNRFWRVYEVNHAALIGSAMPNTALFDGPPADAALPHTAVRSVSSSGS